MTNVSASASSAGVIAQQLRGDGGGRPLRQAVVLPTAVRDQPGDFTLGTVAALFVLLLAITSIPVVLHPWPPMSDYINHLARMQVIATINTDPDLARLYEIDWQLIPNLMMDLIVPQLARVMNIYVAGPIYTHLSLAPILSGPVA